MNSAVDQLLKNEFADYRKKGKPHPLMVKYGVDAVPVDHPNLAEWLETRAPQFADNPLWQKRTGRLADAVSANLGPLQKAGVDTDRLLRALAPLLPRPDDADAAPK